MTQYAVLRYANGDSLSHTQGATRTRGHLESPDSPVLEQVTLDPADLPWLKADPAVQAIAPAMPLKLTKPVAEYSSECDGHSWGIDAVGANECSFDGAGVRIAVLDTGIDSRHQAFRGVRLTIRHFVRSLKADGHGHGTHCAGTIFGRDIQGRRIGVARGVTDALIGKVLQDDGTGDSVALFEAMLWAASEGADLISLSLGFDFPGMVSNLVADGWPVDLATSNALEAYRTNLRMFDAVMSVLRAREPFGASPLVIAATGNESRRTICDKYRVAASLPAAASDVLSVAAVGRIAPGQHRVAHFSNAMAQVCAPGVDILSAATGGTTKVMSGTSMACPHVTGVAALWIQALRREGQLATSHKVRSRLLSSADRASLQGYAEIDLGAGLVRAPRRA